MITIREVKSKKELKDFIFLPARIHKDHKNWMPPIYMDEKNFFNPKKNRSFDTSDTILLLAYSGNEVVGRIMGIINNKYNEFRNEKYGRFGYMECYNDKEVFHSLISYVEKWVRDHGMTKIIGPYGFSDKDIQGFMIRGFEYPPLIDSSCNFEYMIPLMESEGYSKEVDCFTCKFDLGQPFPANYPEIVEKVRNKADYKIIEFTKRSELKTYIIPIFQLVNETYSHLYGFVPMEHAEMVDLAKRYLPILDPRFIKIMVWNNEILGFIIGIPDMTEGIQRSRGHILPFGIFHILRSAKKTRKLDLMLGAVKKKFQGCGFEIYMAMKLNDTLIKAGYKTVEVHLMLETNRQILAWMDDLNSERIKQFRVFQKSL